MLKNSIQKALGHNVNLIESGHCVSAEINTFLNQHSLHCSHPPAKKVKILSTDENSFLYELAKNLKISEHELNFELVNTA
jgi:glutamate racemase